MSPGSVFLDTNVFVYAYDGRDAAKQAKARALIDQVADDCVISSQVIGEFCNVMLTKKGVTMTPDDLQDVLTKLLQPMLAHTPSVDWYRRAVRVFEQHSLHFYDALIIQAAIDLGCTTLYSEDLQDGRQFGELTITNPFK